MKYTWLSHYSIPHLFKNAWVAFGTEKEAQKDQDQVFHPNGIEKVEREPGFEPGDFWRN